jgi:hypothetical protein
MEQYDRWSNSFFYFITGIIVKVIFLFRCLLCAPRIMVSCTSLAATPPIFEINSPNNSSYPLTCYIIIWTSAEVRQTSTCYWISTAIFSYVFLNYSKYCQQTLSNYTLSFC